jgi:hypothetical protein
VIALLAALVPIQQRLGQHILKCAQRASPGRSPQILQVFAWNVSWGSIQCMARPHAPPALGDTSTLHRLHQGVLNALQVHSRTVERARAEHVK